MYFLIKIGYWKKKAFGITNTYTGKFFLREISKPAAVVFPKCRPGHDQGLFTPEAAEQACPGGFSPLPWPAGLTGALKLTHRAPLRQL